MILNAIDEVLFWGEIESLKDFVKENMKRFYPHDYRGSYENYKRFLKFVIPDKAAFVKRLENYEENGAPIWVSGRNALCDDIDKGSMLKAITVSSQIENGEEKAKRASKIQDSYADAYKFYAENILCFDNNYVLELTVGAGGGTNAVMRNMKSGDYYMGADIDFVCAKNADAIAKYYGVNGLGIAASLWSLPFEGEMFTAVCSNNGLGECREVPTILKEAVRLLAPRGRIVLKCEDPAKAQRREIFYWYDFSDEERAMWLRKVRMYSDYKQLEELLEGYGMRKIGQFDGNVYIAVFER